MTTLALYNSKGGVGKTASAVNLAYLSSVEGKNTLLWDLDPQASSTYYYRLRPKVKGGVKKLMKGKQGLTRHIKETEFDRVHLLPSDFSVRKMDIILKGMKKSKKRLRSVLRKLDTRYDRVFLDSPPGFSLLSENIFNASDVILIPLIPTTLSIRTYLQIVTYFEKKKMNTGKLVPFFTQVDRRKKAHLETVDAYTGEGSPFLTTIIPYSSEIENMGRHSAPLPSYSHKSRSTEAYLALWAEIKARLSGAAGTVPSTDAHA
jgi:cellulose biosynthesis protein BcsQ